MNPCVANSSIDCVGSFYNTPIKVHFLKMREEVFVLYWRKYNDALEGSEESMDLYAILMRFSLSCVASNWISTQEMAFVSM